MNKNYLIIFFLLLCFSFSALSQSDAGMGITKNFFVGIGGTYSDFQDTKYSDVRESGMGAHLKFGFNNLKTGRHFWEAGVFVNFSFENADTHDQASSTMIYPNVYFKYLKGISNKVYLGARVDILDYYIKTYSNLNNNGTFANSGNHLYVSVLFQTRLSDKWKFRAEGDLALIGIQNEGTGFAMSYSQNRIEQGGIDYQDPKMGDPGSYKYAEFKYIGNNLILKTGYSFMLKKRFSFSYDWEMRRYATIPGYPTTWGVHNIVVRFNIIHRGKKP